MKKNIVLTLLFLSSLCYSASVYQNRCIDDYYFSNNKFYYHVINAPSYSSTSRLVRSYDILTDFIVKNNSCRLDSNATALNITSSMFNFLHAFLGLIFGSMFTFFVISLFMMRRK